MFIYKHINNKNKMTIRLSNFVNGKSNSAGGYNISDVINILEPTDFFIEELYSFTRIEIQLYVKDLLKNKDFIKIFEKQPINTSKESKESKKSKESKLNKTHLINNYYIKSKEYGGGGDCFFYVICEGLRKLYNMNYKPIDLRKIVYKHLMEKETNERFLIINSIYNKKDKEELANYFLKSISDADDYTMNVISEHFKMCLLIYNRNTKKMNCFNEVNGFDSIICMYYTGGHYQLGIILDNDEEIFSILDINEITSRQRELFHELTENKILMFCNNDIFN